METFKIISAWLVGLIGLGLFAYYALYVWCHVVEQTASVLRMKAGIIDYWKNRKQFKEWLAAGKPRAIEDS